MKTVTHRTPVAVFYPPTEQYIIVQRGDEYEDNHPFVKDKANAYLFEEDRGEGARLYPTEQVEQATSAPGEKRSYRRKAEKDDGEPVEPKKDKGSGNGPIRSDSI